MLDHRAHNPLTTQGHPLQESAIRDEVVEQEVAHERRVEQEAADDDESKESGGARATASEAAAEGDEDGTLRTVYGGEVDEEFFERIKAQSAAEREARLLAKRRPGRASLPDEGWIWAVLRRFTHAWESERPEQADGGYGNGERGACTGI